MKADLGPANGGPHACAPAHMSTHTHTRTHTHTHTPVLCYVASLPLQEVLGAQHAPNVIAQLVVGDEQPLVPRAHRRIHPVPAPCQDQVKPGQKFRSPLRDLR